MHADHRGELRTSTGQFSAAGNASYPGKLPALLGALLDGQDIDEPFELWS